MFCFLLFIIVHRPSSIVYLPSSIFHLLSSIVYRLSSIVSHLLSQVLFDFEGKFHTHIPKF